MSTERNMQRRRSLFGPMALALLVWVIGGLMWGGSPAQAQTATAPAPAPASATTDSTLSIPVSGTMTTATGTKVNYSGFVVVNSSAVTNVVGIPPFVMLNFDFSNVNATSGAGANTVTYNTSTFQVNKIRLLQPTDTIVMTAPVNQKGASVTSATASQATVTLSFDSAGNLTSGTIVFGNNTFSSTV
jgi:hypothetical protein